VKQALQRARDTFVVEPSLAGVQAADRQIAEPIIKGALAESMQVATFIAAALALAGAAVGGLIPRSIKQPK
jgi:hypothetical protein